MRLVRGPKRVSGPRCHSGMWPTGCRFLAQGRRGPRFTSCACNGLLLLLRWVKHFEFVPIDQASKPLSVCRRGSDEGVGAWVGPVQILARTGWAEYGESGKCPGPNGGSLTWEPVFLPGMQLSAKSHLVARCCHLDIISACLALGSPPLLTGNSYHPALRGSCRLR